MDCYSLIRSEPDGTRGKESTCQRGKSGKAREMSLIPRLGRSPRGRPGNLFQVFLLVESTWTEEPGGLQSTGLHRVGQD